MKKGNHKKVKKAPESMALVPLEGLEDVKKNPVYVKSRALVVYEELEGRRAPRESFYTGSTTNEKPDAAEGRKAISSKKSTTKNKDKDKRNKTVEIDYKAKGYPKKRLMPVDIEVIDGNKNIYFNIEKYLDYTNKKFILKIIPLHILDKLTYNVGFLDKYAQTLYKKTMKYNQSTPKEQYALDKNRSFRTWGVRAIALSLVVLFIFMMIIPGQHMRTAMAELKNGNYQEAFFAFQKAPSTELNNYYKQYSLAMGQMQAGKYSEAKENLKRLVGYEAPYVDLKVSMNEILYQEAESLYHEGKYAEAAECLKLTYNYKDSKERFYEASYMALDELMKDKKYESAMKLLSLLGNYKDSTAKGQMMAEEIYQEAHEKYALKMYEDAENLFKYVAQIDYKDSKTMIYQAQYNSGLQYYKDGQYEQALTQLNKISWFKDSSAMLNDVYYRRGLALKDENPSQAYDSFVNCLAFRDTEQLLQGAPFAMYGRWRVLSVNESALNHVELEFTGDNKFLSTTESKALRGLDINNYDDVIYTYSNGSYASNASDSVVIPHAQSLTSVSLEVTKGNVKDILQLQRIGPIAKTSVDFQKVIRDSLMDYIDLKLGNIEKETQE